MLRPSGIIVRRQGVAVNRLSRDLATGLALRTPRTFSSRDSVVMLSSASVVIAGAQVVGATRLHPHEH
jgi:hypothetical protein